MSQRYDLAVQMVDIRRRRNNWHGTSPGRRRRRSRRNSQRPQTTDHRLRTGREALRSSAAWPRTSNQQQRVTTKRGTMKIDGYQGSVALDGDTVTIHKNLRGDTRSTSARSPGSQSNPPGSA